MPSRSLASSAARSSTPANTDLGDIARIRPVWQQFYADLNATDKRVLDRAAAGEKLKVVCYELDVPYDTVQKRFKRWQTQLALPSLQTLLVVWRIVRSSRRALRTDRLVDPAPALLRHAPELAIEYALQEHDAQYEVRLPEKFKACHTDWPSAVLKQAMTGSRALALAEAVFSPALWFALLVTGQENQLEGLRQALVPQQHLAFLQLLGVASGSQTHGTVQALQKVVDEESAADWLTLAGTPFALPLLCSGRALGRYSSLARSAAEARLRAAPPLQQRHHWEHFAERVQVTAYDAHNDVALWQRFCAVTHDVDAAMTLLRGVSLDVLLGPLAGLCVAVALAHPRFAASHSVLFKIWRAMLIARVRHAQSLGISPPGLLAYFSMEESGIATAASYFALQPDESLLDDVDIDPLPAWGQPRAILARDILIETYALRDMSSLPLTEKPPVKSAERARLRGAQ
jgi:hypothetical protein